MKRKKNEPQGNPFSLAGGGGTTQLSRGDVQKHSANKRDSFLGGLDTQSGQDYRLKTQAPQVKNPGQLLVHAYEHLQAAV